MINEPFYPLYQNVIPEKKAVSSTPEALPESKARSLFPILALVLLVLLLFLTNYKWGTYLTGWDNLHPEFDFGLNIRRSLFAVWQEYQGVGLLGGMAHGADILRQIFLFAVSFVMPQSLLRYFWTFLMLLTGPVGAYCLIHSLLNKPGQAAQKSNIKNEISSRQWHSFLGASFYLFNLATVQMFFVSFEAFVAFYGFLPWLLFAVIKFLQVPDTRRLLFLGIVLLLATPAWYLQTLFLVFLIALTVILVRYYNSGVSPPSRSGKLKITFSVYLLVFLINAFWLLPQLYFVITSADIPLAAKINQMATDTVFLQNKEFGTLNDVMMLKGFMLNSVDPNLSGQFAYMLSAWRDHLSNPLVILIGYILFFVVFLGFLKAIRSRYWEIRSFSSLFILVFVSLAIAFPPFSFVNDLIREHLLFNELFRFPFTKFSTLASLTFAVLFALGVREINYVLSDKEAILKIKNKILNMQSKNKIFPFFRWIFNLLYLIFNFFVELKHRAPRSISLILVILLLLFTFPVFRGELFYNKERLNIPKEYKELFAFFKEQDQNSRIANFPQPNFWGWTFYDWGYGGSGFLWYGIKQPILDRNFDMWSPHNENYYYEMSQSLYAKDHQAFRNVLDKYQIKWLLVDKSIYYPSSKKSLFFPEIENMLDSTGVKKEAVFGKIEVYRIDLKNEPQNFAYITPRLPEVSSYKWSSSDPAFASLGDYISPSGDLNELTLYPFNSLFTLKTQKDLGFMARDSEWSISLSRDIPAQKNSTLFLPSLARTDGILPFEIRTEKTQNGPLVTIRALYPTVFLGEKEIARETGPVFYTVQVPSLPSADFPLRLNINGVKSFNITNEDKLVGTSFLVASTSNNLVLSDKSKKVLAESSFGPDLINSLSQEREIKLPPAGPTTLTVSIPKIRDDFLSFEPSLDQTEKTRKCNNFGKGNFSSVLSGDRKELVISSSDTTSCTAFYSRYLPHDQGYIAFAATENIVGRPLRFWIENINEEYAPLDTYLPDKDASSALILPPMDKNAISYAFHFDNISIGKTESRNILKSFKVFPVFYKYLSGMNIRTGPGLNTSKNIIYSFSASHPNESFYRISGINYQTEDEGGNGQLSRENATLVLSQGYDRGWKAYLIQNSNLKTQNFLTDLFPFFFGREIKEHVKVNNWENGWILDSNSLSPPYDLIIVYLPQYLQYLGCGLLLGFPFLLWRWRGKEPIK